MAEPPPRPVVPRRLAHRGRVEAAGVALLAPLLDEEAARRRVLEEWRIGSRVFRVPGGLLLRWPGTRSLRVEAALGTPVVRAGGVLLAAPLTAAELAAVGVEATADGLPPVPPPVNSVKGGTPQRAASCLILIAAGRCSAVPLDDAELDPSTWLELGSLELLDPRPLGASAALPGPPALATPALAEVIPAVPRSSPDVARFVAGLRAQEAHARTRGAGGDAASERALVRVGEIGRPVTVVVRRFGPVRRWLRRVLGLSGATTPVIGGGAGGAAGASGGGVRGRSGAPSRPPPPREPNRLSRWLREWLLRTPLARYLATWQEQYLARMLAMFRENRLDEALRHAIPLAGSDGAEPLPSLGVPRPRDELTFGRPRATDPRALVAQIPGLAETLEEQYRAAYARLVREGRVDDAAFVLFELLGADEEGVALLERHGRFGEAARIGEARGLDPARCVRLYLLAGLTEQAVGLASRTGALAAAIAQLERGDAAERELADALRERFAWRLVEAGDLVGAVELVWRDRWRHPNLPLVDWIARAAGLGGAIAGRMLAYWAGLSEELEEALWVRAAPLVTTGGPYDGDAARVMLARTLPSVPSTFAAQSLARATVRALLVDADGSMTSERRRLLGAVATFSGDRALCADLPAVAVVDPPTRPIDRTLALEAAELGARPIHDAALLPDGRMLVAVGEAGVLLLARDGRTVHRFEEPGYRLVVSDSGTRAVALARRGREEQLTRIDLERRLARPWGQLRLGVWADTYDGAHWVVAGLDDLIVLDALAEEPRAVWRARGAGVTLLLARDEAGWAAVVKATQSFSAALGPPEIWRYTVPGPTLRGRKQVAHWPVEGIDRADMRPVVAGLTPGGLPILAFYSVPPGSERANWDPRADLLVATHPSNRPRPLATWELPGPFATTDALVALTLHVSMPREVPHGLGSYTVRVVPRRGEETLLEVKADAQVGRRRARVTALRLVDERLLLGDSEGRLLVYDLATGETVLRTLL